MNLLKLAGKNTLRKKGRTITAVLSIAFALFLAVFFRSMGWGSYDMLISAAVKSSGALQIHRNGYWANLSIDDLFRDSAKLRETISGVQGITEIIPRLENVALACGENDVQAVSIVGIDPETENDFNSLANKLTKGGKFLNPNDKGVLLAEGLATFLKLGVGDTAVFIGQGYQAQTAAAKLEVKGILHYDNDQLNSSYAFTTIESAQELNGAPAMLSAYMIEIDSRQNLEYIQKQLRLALGSEYEVMGWSDLTPEIAQQISADSTLAGMMLFALYLVVGFGILGTLLMMTMERRKEFGMLNALGMKKRQQQLLVFFETTIIGIVGTVVGLGAALPICYYYNTNPMVLTGEMADGFKAMGAEPIIQFSMRPDIFAAQGAIVGLMIFVAAMVPIYLVRKIKMIDVLK